MFSMLRQLKPKQQKLKIASNKADHGVQVQLVTYNKDQPGFSNEQQIKHKKIKKRNCMQISLQDKQISQMNFRQRRRLLKAMRDSIQQQFRYGQGMSLSSFKPQNNNYNFSGVDETIKTAIQKLKESDISTHIFLKHYANQLSEEELNDIKDFNQIFSQDNVSKIIKFTTSYKEKKLNQKKKLKIKSQTIKQTIKPQQIHNKSKQSLSLVDSLLSIDEQPNRKKLHSIKKMRFPSVLSRLEEQQKSQNNQLDNKYIKDKESNKSSQNEINKKLEKLELQKKLRKIISIQSQSTGGKIFQIQRQKRQSFFKQTSTATSSVEIKNSILKKTILNKKQLNSKMKRLSRNSFI